MLLSYIILQKQIDWSESQDREHDGFPPEILYSL